MVNTQSPNQTRIKTIADRHAPKHLGRIAGRAHHTSPIHPLYIPYSPPIHPSYTPYTPPIHPLYTPYTPPIARHVARCRFPYELRVQSARGDVTGSIRQALIVGASRVCFACGQAVAPITCAMLYVVGRCRLTL